MWYPMTPLRAALSLGLLLGMCELLRLVCFGWLHAEALNHDLAPAAIAAQTLSAWPEGLEVRLTRRNARDAPSLWVNEALPFEVALPVWLATSLNLALSFTMRSAVVLHFLNPRGPTLLMTKEAELPRELRAAARNGGEIRMALTEHRLHIVDVVSEEPVAALHYHMFEVLARHLCEPWRPSNDVPAGMEGSSGFSCRKRHVVRLVSALRSPTAHFVAITFRPTLLMSMCAQSR